MKTAHDKEAFLHASTTYLDELNRASNFDEMLSLWRKTSIPYSMDGLDPYSLEYKEEVKSLYTKLTNCDYSPNNELTSTKQSQEDFEIGFPWISGNLGIVAEEMAKPVQILHTLHASGKAGARIIEFGAGWGNLALPLARARQDVTIVDIDEGFINRILRKAEQEGLKISSYCGDFVEIAKSVTERFDVVIFQSSFHHCVDFMELLRVIKSQLLADDGMIIFASEPISNDIQFPWGLRYDGESLWAIMCNKWLELGFNHDFFSEMLISTGFFFERVPGIAGFVGEAWKASRSEIALDFAKWVLPSWCDHTFHSPDPGGAGRFCAEQSILPGLKRSTGKAYELTFVNYGTQPLALKVRGERKESLVVGPGRTEIVRIPVGPEALHIDSQTFVPDRQCGNGDMRTLGVNLLSVRLS